LSHTNLTQCVDVGDAIANTVGLHQTEGKIVELAGPETVSWTELVDIVSDLVGEPASRLPTPAVAAYAFGLFNEYTWRPGFTADFARRMQHDVLESKNPEILKFSDVGITPQRIETAAHEFLARWKRNPDYFLVCFNLFILTM
jgi:nucleoside-diphosphate-sugar epimerase